MLAWKTACPKVGQWLWQASQPEKPASQSASQPERKRDKQTSQSAKRKRPTSQPERPRPCIIYANSV